MAPKTASVKQPESGKQPPLAVRRRFNNKIAATFNATVNGDRNPLIKIQNFIEQTLEQIEEAAPYNLQLLYKEAAGEFAHSLYCIEKNDDSFLFSDFLQRLKDSSNVSIKEALACYQAFSKDKEEGFGGRLHAFVLQARDLTEKKEITASGEAELIAAVTNACQHRENLLLLKRQQDHRESLPSPSIPVTKQVPSPAPEAKPLPAAKKMSDPKEIGGFIFFDPEKGNYCDYPHVTGRFEKPEKPLPWNIPLIPN